MMALGRARGRLRAAGRRNLHGWKVRVAFALDRCGREAMAHVATTGGITADDVRDLMATSVEHRHGQVIRPPGPMEPRKAPD